MIAQEVEAKMFLSKTTDMSLAFNAMKDKFKAEMEEIKRKY